MTDALLAAIAADPFDLDSYRVLADALEAAGDPRGALITMQLALERLTDDNQKLLLTTRIREHMTAHHAELVGELRGLDLTWRRGFVHAARFETYRPDDGMLDRLAILLEHPSARFLVELAITARGEVYPHELLVETLGPHIPRTLRTLQLVFPPGLDLGGLDLAHVTRLLVRGDTLPSLATVPAPMLEDLSLFLSYDKRITTATVRALLDRTDLPHLTRLRFAMIPFVEDFVLTLADTPIGQQLVELDLSHCLLGTELAAAWAARPRPHRIARLYVAAYVSPDARNLLRGTVADEILTGGPP